MRFLKYAPLTIKAGEQASNDVVINPMTVAHALYAPKGSAGQINVQCQTWGTDWCDLENAAIGKSSCVALPILACNSLRVESSTIETEDRQYIYAYLYQE